jgi:hypothetical protein
MNAYRHHVSGFFANHAEAESAQSRLMERGIPRDRLKLVDERAAAAPPTAHAGSNEVLRDVVVDGAIGVAAGAGIGALAELALVAANVSLFIASPLIAPLAMLGWGASLGGFIGATLGAGEKSGTFSALVMDAISSGQSVLIAETLSPAETDFTREVMQVSVNNYRDVAVA